MRRNIKEMEMYTWGIQGQQNNQFGPSREKNYHTNAFYNWQTYDNDKSTINLQANTWDTTTVMRQAS